MISRSRAVDRLSKQAMVLRRCGTAKTETDFSRQVREALSYANRRSGVNLPLYMEKDTDKQVGSVGE